MGNENKDFRTPGQLVEHLLAQKGWTKKTLAVILGVGEAKITRLTGDKQPLDAKAALVLEDVFGVPAEQFLALQKEYELAQARIVTRPDPDRATRAALYGDLPLADMIRRGWIEADNVRQTEKIETELSRFFGVNRLDDIPVLPHAAKKTAVSEPATAA